jgi:predicted O-methyltransferase YrrM
MTLQEELMVKWLPTIRKSDHIKTWTGDGELAYVAEEASKHNIIVEVGTYLGRSAKVMLDANPAAHLWYIDPGLVDFVFETSQYFLRDEIAQGRCEGIKKFTPEAAVMLEHMRGKIDMVWIDGGHAFNDVYTDIKFWGPLLRMGGLMCGHDFEFPPRYPEMNDVAKAVQHCLFSSWSEPVPRVWAYTKNKEPW